MSKKNKKILTGFLLTVLFAINASLTAQTGWYPLQSGTSNVLKAIYFVNPNTGYMAGNGIVLKTLNGGINWLVITTNFGGTSISFLNEYTGYVCDGTMYKTTDGGISWTNLYLASLVAVDFTDINTGYAVGLNSEIIKTTNGGITWEQQFVNIYYNKFNSVTFVNPSVGYIAGGRMFTPYEGMLYKTVNGGSSWYSVSPSALDIDFRSIDFPSATTGYVVGGYEYGSSGVVYKSTDAGETWMQWGIVNKDLNATHFWTNDIGYAVGEEGTILKTTNGSIVWNTQVSSSNKELNAVYFLKSNLGFTAGASGSVQKTINGGVSGPPFAIAGRITFPSGLPVTRGIVKALKFNPVTNTVQVLDTAGIQANGDYILRNVPQDSVDIMVIPNDEDEDNPPPQFVPLYYTGTGSGTIYWTQSNTLYANINIFNVDIRVFNITGTGGSGIISGGVYVAPPQVSGLQDAVVYAMIGNEFKGYSISRTGGPYDVNNIPQGSYYMVCDRMGYRSADRYVTLGGINLDTINFYLTRIGVIGIEPNGNIIPSAYKLEQNYPNPFNPSTKIKLDVPRDSYVKLAVYDMLGREVETLVNQMLKAGSYQASWNASRYSSGIYFYKIFSADFTDTKKMILVK